MNFMGIDGFILVLTGRKEKKELKIIKIKISHQKKK